MGEDRSARQGKKQVAIVSVFALVALPVEAAILVHQNSNTDPAKLARMQSPAGMGDPRAGTVAVALYSVNPAPVVLTRN